MEPLHTTIQTFSVGTCVKTILKVDIKRAQKYNPQVVETPSMEDPTLDDAILDVLIDRLHTMAEKEENSTSSGSVAQWKEQLPSKQSVVGSIPT